MAIAFAANISALGADDPGSNPGSPIRNIFKTTLLRLNMAKTKKVGSTGRFGVRYGKRIKRKVLEIDNALSELTNVKEAYKLIGQVIILSDKKKLESDLKSKKEILELRIKSLEKQESQLKEKSSSLREEVLKELKQKE